ncbi:two-component response regulator 24-like [Punica granatum]|uniref:Response regulatory domain-containing protein n=2 Tax=Punica granatum TaxID=22663 RepID=A0A218X6R1_PUNGR|nr:two-component response regulator 24-like [Punica granatum]OWM80360.1 hypothetical protein CDL15_Pgr019640 [Punica granatum]PKI52930.1 hypothetical protein CRG98_026761 [Punica granatum]
MASGIGASSHSPKKAKTEYGDSRKFGRFTVATPSKIIKVLIVEDDDTLRALQKMIIDSLDMPVAVHEAADGREAVDMCRATPFDAIFMDLGMPVMNGIEATKALRDMGSRSTIIGMVSGTVNNDELVRAFEEAGLNECYRLPMSANDFRSILQRVWNEI